MTNEPKAGKGIDPELLAAYVDRRLSPEQIAEVEARLASDPDAYALVVESMKTLDEQESTTSDVVPMPPLKRSGIGGRWVIAAGALATAAMVILAIRFLPAKWYQPGGGEEPSLAKLVEAVGQRRYLEPRVTGGFHYGPIQPANRSANSRENLSLLAAAGEIQQRAGAAPTLTNLHAYAIARLLIGEYDAGIRDLEFLAASSDGSATIQSDLAAAYLARAAATASSADLPKALAASEQALRIDPALLTAKFNRALALDRLSLAEEALEAWRAYVRVETDEQWRSEAEDRIQRLVPLSQSRNDLPGLLAAIEADATSGWQTTALTLVQRYPRVAEEWIADVALARWAANPRASAAVEWLDKAEFVAVRLGTTDGSAIDMVRVARRASTADPGNLAEAHKLFALGRVSYQEFKISEARRQFSRAIALSTSSPSLSIYSRIHEAITQYYEDDLAGAHSSLTQLSESATSQGYQSYAARAQWMLGIIAGARSRFSESQRAYRHAHAIYERLYFRDYVAVMDGLLADSYSTLGDYNTAWAHITRALHYWRSDSEPRRHYSALLTASVLARRAGYSNALPALHGALIAVARRWDNKVGLVQAHLERARAYAQLGNSDAAHAELQAAYALFNSLPDEPQRRTLEGQLLRVDAAIAGPTETDRALGNLRRASAIYGSAGSSLQLIEIQLAAVRALRKVGRQNEAKQLADEGLSLIDKQRRTVASADLRISYVDRVWDLALEAMDMAVEAGDLNTAFDIAEKGRNRVAFELTGVVEPTRSLAEVRAALPPDGALLYYAVLETQWTAWVVTRSTATIHRGDLGSVLSAVDRFRLALARKDSASARQQLVELSKQVWWPLLDDLGTASRVWVCPDGVFANIPYAALVTPDGRRFIETRSVTLTASARVQTDSRPSVVQAGVLSPSVSGEYPALPGAASEAQRVAAVYGVTPVVGSVADRSTAVRTFATRDVVHFAGHAVANEQAPGATRLIVNGPNGQADALTASDIEQIPIKRGATIVLAACSSVSPSVRRGEGALTLARPFLVRGAGIVVGTLWDVDDAAVVAVFVELHKGIVVGQEPAEALAAAQRNVLASADAQSVLDWAAIVAVRSGLNIIRN